MVEDEKSLVIRFPDFGIRVQELSAKHGVTIKDIQLAVGVGYEMARRYSMGVSKPDDAGMLALATLLKVLPSELDWGPTESRNYSSLDDAYYQLRYYHDVRLSAGHGANNNGHKAPQLKPVPKWMLPDGIDPNMIVIVPVKGSSMTGELEDGSLACVDTGDKTRFKDGKIYAYNQGDETMVKYFYTRVGGGILIKAKNAAEFPDQVVAPYDLKNLDVVGRVIAGLNRYWM